MGGQDLAEEVVVDRDDAADHRQGPRFEYSREWGNDREHRQQQDLGQGERGILHWHPDGGSQSGEGSVLNCEDDPEDQSCDEEHRGECSAVDVVVVTGQGDEHGARDERHEHADGVAGAQDGACTRPGGIEETRENDAQIELGDAGESGHGRNFCHAVADVLCREEVGGNSPEDQSQQGPGSVGGQEGERAADETVAPGLRHRAGNAHEVRRLRITLHAREWPVGRVKQLVDKRSSRVTWRPTRETTSPAAVPRCAPPASAPTLRPRAVMGQLPRRHLGKLGRLRTLPPTAACHLCRRQRQSDAAAERCAP